MYSIWVNIVLIVFLHMHMHNKAFRKGKYNCMCLSIHLFYEHFQFEQKKKACEWKC